MAEPVEPTAPAPKDPAVVVEAADEEPEKGAESKPPATKTDEVPGPVESGVRMDSYEQGK